MIWRALTGLVVTGLVAVACTLLAWEWWSRDPLNFDMNRWPRCDVLLALRPWLSIGAGVATVVLLEWLR